MIINISSYLSKNNNENLKKKIIKEISIEEIKIFPTSFYNENQIKDILNDESYKVFIFLKENIEKIIYNKMEILGYLIVYDSYDAFEIMKIGIKESQRNKGIGSKLIQNFISESKKQILLEVRESNLEAINFYKKNNFEVISIRKNYYFDNNENALIMLKENKSI